MRRREFIALIGGAVAASPALGQQQSGIRHIGVLSQGSIHNHPTPEFRAFLERLGELGWTENHAVYYDYLLGAAQAIAPSLGIEAVPSHIENDAADIERAIAAIASIPNSGMVVLPESTTTINRNLIITLAARNRLPAIYNMNTSIEFSAVPNRPICRCRLRPNNETALNLKTAKALGLTVSAGLLVAADEVIE